MKRTLILVLVLSFFFVTLLQGEEKIATSGGRYQLLQVTYKGSNYNNNTKYTEETVLKIDTETGKTYYLIAQISDMTSGQEVLFAEIPTYTFKENPKDKLIDFSDLTPPAPPKTTKPPETQRSKFIEEKVSEMEAK
jgi:hypothetical protein